MCIIIRVIPLPMQRFALCRGSWLYSYLTLLLSVSCALLLLPQVGQAFVPTVTTISPNPTTISCSRACFVREQQVKTGGGSSLLSLNASRAVGEDREKSASHHRDSDNALGVVIKPATFHGLRAVSRMLVEEFYGNTILFPAQYLVELNRLQTNFHEYGEDSNRHLMLVATWLEDGSLAGFVDIDGRPRKKGQQGEQIREREGEREKEYLLDMICGHTGVSCVHIQLVDFAVVRTAIPYATHARRR